MPKIRPIAKFGIAKLIFSQRYECLQSSFKISRTLACFFPPGDTVYTCLCGFHPVACLVAIEINENRDDSRMCHPKRSAVKQASDDGRFQERPVRSICRCAHSRGVARAVLRHCQQIRVNSKSASFFEGRGYRFRIMMLRDHMLTPRNVSCHSEIQNKKIKPSSTRETADCGRQVRRYKADSTTSLQVALSTAPGDSISKI